MRPVFLHGMWRSGSTWLWSRFRESGDALCFYEPLHHGLAKLTPERIARCTRDTIRSNRHPELRASYWQEYAPLVAGRGVRRFSRSLSERDYCLQRGQSHPKLERYVASLVDHARAQRRVPVLGFNRSGGRIAWLKHRFDSFDIQISRAPQAVWASYAAEAQAGNHAYFGMWLRVVSANQNHPVWRPLAEHLGLAPWVSHGLRRMTRMERRWVRALSAEDSYLLTAYAAAVCRAHAEHSVDLTIDEGLTAEPGLRRALEDQIEASTGLAVSLEGFRPAPSRVILDPAVKAAVEAELRLIFPVAAVRKLAGSGPIAHGGAAVTAGDRPTPLFGYGS